jgi:hypothetical protein
MNPSRQALSASLPQLEAICRDIAGAPGGFLVINRSTSAVHGSAVEEPARQRKQAGTPPMTLRNPHQIAHFLRRAGSSGAWRGVVFTLAARP